MLCYFLFWLRDFYLFSWRNTKPLSRVLALGWCYWCLLSTILQKSGSNIVTKGKMKVLTVITNTSVIIPSCGMCLETITQTYGIGVIHVFVVRFKDHTFGLVEVLQQVKWRMQKWNISWLIHYPRFFFDCHDFLNRRVRQVTNELSFQIYLIQSILVSSWLDRPLQDFQSNHQALRTVANNDEYSTIHDDNYEICQLKT